MKKILIFLFSLVILSSCENNQRPYQGTGNTGNVYVTPEVPNLGENLDLQSLGELVKNSTSATDVEQKLNSEGSINNLDLNNDGNVDYISVHESGDGNNRVLTFTIEQPNGVAQEVASISMDKNNDNVNMNIVGHESLYGNQGYYNSNYLLRDLLIYNYLFSYHPLYRSPYHYGYYPNTYRSYHRSPVSSYRNRVSNTTKTTKITRTSKPNTSKVSSNKSSYSKPVSSVGKTLSSPTKSQKSFTKTSSFNSKPKTGGFGSSSNKSSSSFGSSSSNRSSNRSSSFGSSSKKSGSSFGSSSSRSSGRSSSSRRK